MIIQFEVASLRNEIRHAQMSGNPPLVGLANVTERLLNEILELQARHSYGPKVDGNGEAGVER